jgi:hypothetical protein
MTMKRGLLLTLAVVCFVGCKFPGTQPKPLISQTSPQTPTAQVAETHAPQNENQDAGFSFSRLFQMAGFQKSETPAPSLVPQDVVNLGNVINTVTAKSMELSVSDPPEVTRQKAQEILDSLQTWDSTLAASTSTGLVNGEMAQTLNTWVGQLRGEAQKLVQYVPNPQTIAAIQQLAGSLHSTFGDLSSMLNQGSAFSQAFLGVNRS